MNFPPFRGVLGGRPGGSQPETLGHAEQGHQWPRSSLCPIQAVRLRLGIALLEASRLRDQRRLEAEQRFLLSAIDGQVNTFRQHFGRHMDGLSSSENRLDDGGCEEGQR